MKLNLENVVKGAVVTTTFGVGGLMLWLLFDNESEDTEIIDCSSALMKFYNKCVRLSDYEQQKLRDHRNINQQRLEDGLAREGFPPRLYFVQQGSYAMDTINQSPENDYDIDDGVVFDREALKEVHRRDMTAREAKEMVCSILHHTGFSKPPQVLKNCVRVYYAQGHHVDIPVYRQHSHWFWDKTVTDLASGDEWRESNPKAVCEWFNKAVKDKSPDTEKGRQLRRIVRLLKAYSKSRPSWKMPSGFILSILAIEKYQAFEGRDDLSLYETMKAIHARLQGSLSVEHPIFGRDIALDKKTRMELLRDQLGRLLKSMQGLENEGCTEKDALGIWSKVFNTNFFTDPSTTQD